MGICCIKNFALFALATLFYHGESCSIMCPDNQKPCGTYDAFCKGTFVGCSLPEECICLSIKGKVTCQITKRDEKGMYTPFIDFS